MVGLFIGSIFIICITAKVRSSNQIYMSIAQNEISEAEKTLAEQQHVPLNGFCELNTNQILTHLNQYIYLPTLLMRLFSYFYLPKMEAEKVKEAGAYLGIYFHGSYGAWCLYNISRFRSSSILCRRQLGASMISYQMAIIFGVYSGSLVLLMTIVLIVAIPLVCYILWKNHRDRTA